MCWVYGRQYNVDKYTVWHCQTPLVYLSLQPPFWQQLQLWSHSLHIVQRRTSMTKFFPIIPQRTVHACLGQIMIVLWRCGKALRLVLKQHRAAVSQPTLSPRTRTCRNTRPKPDGAFATLHRSTHFANLPIRFLLRLIFSFSTRLV